MNDRDKTKEQLINELKEMRQRVTSEAEHKQMEEALQEHAKHYATASRLANLGYWDRDFIFNMAHWSNEVCSIFGVDPEEFHPTWENFLSLVHPSDREQLSDKVRVSRESGTPLDVEYRIKRPDGIERLVHSLSEVRYDEKGKPVGLIGSLQDITERKEMEAALVKSLQLFQSLAEQSPNMIFINRTGRIVYANSSCEAVMGYRRKEFYSPHFDFLTLIAPEYRDMVKDSLGRHLLGEEVPSHEYTLLTKDGKRLDVIHATRLIEYEGESALLGTITDITESKRLEEERRKTERLESVGTLAGGIAHDFNNFLTGILGNINLAQRYTEPGSQTADRLLEAERASLKARDLTQQLLTFARGGAPILKTASIADVIRDSSAFILSGSNVKCEYDLPDDLWPVEIDEGQMSQVIQNLVINANEAMPEGGTVNITVENTELKAREHLPLSRGKYVEITIEDPGTGISKEHLAKIFDPYFTTKQKGSGLGLSTAYSIVKNHGGHITASSELGTGTIFHICLPASKKRIPKKKQEVVQPSLLGKGRVLVMDDEETIRKLLYRTLTNVGYEVELTEDGVEAIERYSQARDSGQSFDAVIMDLTIPGGMGGEEAIEKLLEVDPNAKVVVSSGYATDPIMSDFREYGFSGVVTKPYRIVELEKTLSSILK